MNPELVEALKGSIEHWRRMRQNARGAFTASLEGPTWRHCALCRFFDKPGRDPKTSPHLDCKSCPTECYYEEVEEPRPQTLFQKAFYAWDDYVQDNQDEAETAWLEAADAEIAHLESLLPEGDLKV